MKVLTAAEMREADQYTIIHEPISSTKLMERASFSCFTKIASYYGNEPFFIVFCGGGNNGGDGLAIARMMKEKGLRAAVVDVPFPKKSDDNLFMYAKAMEAGVEFTDRNIIASSKHVVIVDAILGTGISKNPSGEIAEAIEFINSSGKEIVSVDLPSGMFADQLSGECVIRANRTFTFQNPKMAMLFPENEKFLGEWEILNIGLDEKFIEDHLSQTYLITENTLPKIPQRRKFSHKGLYGHSLIVAGSKGKTGAAVLAARACLKTGTGLLTVHIPETSYDIMQISVPEAMVQTDKDPNINTGINSFEGFNAIGIGPGIGTENDTISLVKNLFENYHRPIVIDADALNIISKNSELLKLVPQYSILTPHPKEFSRLAGESKNSFDQFEKQKEFSKRYNVIVVLKGAHTCITSPDGKIYFNTTGNPGMAKGGTGDVLTGMITALLAQEFSPVNSAMLGVYLHGLAGDIAVKKKGEHSMTASDLLDKIGAAFKKIKN